MDGMLATQSSKSKKKKKAEELPSYTQDFSLGDKEYVVNFRERIKKLHGQDPNPSDEDEDALDDDARWVKQKAKEMEEKYGRVQKKGGIGRAEMLRAEMGFGYDTEDPFIDDSEPFDEMLPPNMEPEHGGYYINEGVLNLRETCDRTMTPHSSVSGTPTALRKRVIADSDEDERGNVAKKSKKKVREVPFIDITGSTPRPVKEISASAKAAAKLKRRSLQGMKKRPTVNYGDVGRVKEEVTSAAGKTEAASVSTSVSLSPIRLPTSRPSVSEQLVQMTIQQATSALTPEKAEQNDISIIECPSSNSASRPAPAPSSTPTTPPVARMSGQPPMQSRASALAQLPQPLRDWVMEFKKKVGPNGTAGNMRVKWTREILEFIQRVWDCHLEDIRVAGQSTQSGAQVATTSAHVQSAGTSTQPAARPPSVGVPQPQQSQPQQLRRNESPRLSDDETSAIIGAIVGVTKVLPSHSDFLQTLLQMFITGTFEWSETMERGLANLIKASDTAAGSKVKREDLVAMIAMVVGTSEQGLNLRLRKHLLPAQTPQPPAPSKPALDTAPAAKAIKTDDSDDIVILKAKVGEAPTRSEARQQQKGGVVPGSSGKTNSVPFSVTPTGAAASGTSSAPPTANRTQPSKGPLARQEQLLREVLRPHVERSRQNGQWTDEAINAVFKHVIMDLIREIPSGGGDEIVMELVVKPMNQIIPITMDEINRRMMALAAADQIEQLMSGTVMMANANIVNEIFTSAAACTAGTLNMAPSLPSATNTQSTVIHKKSTAAPAQKPAAQTAQRQRTNTQMVANKRPIPNSAASKPANSAEMQRSMQQSSSSRQSNQPPQRVLHSSAAAASWRPSSAPHKASQVPGYRRVQQPYVTNAGGRPRVHQVSDGRLSQGTPGRPSYNTGPTLTSAGLVQSAPLNLSSAQIRKTNVQPASMRDVVPGAQRVVVQQQLSTHNTATTYNTASESSCEQVVHNRPQVGQQPQQSRGAFS